MDTGPLVTGSSQNRFSQAFTMTEEALMSSPLIHPVLLLLYRFLAASWFVSMAFVIYAGQDFTRGIPVQVTLSWISSLFIGLYFSLITMFTISRREAFMTVCKENYAFLLHSNLAICSSDITKSIGYMAWVLFELLVPTACVVFCVFWGFIAANTAHPTQLSSVSMHIVNVVTLSVELVLNRHIIVPRHARLALMAGCVYLVHMFMYHLITGKFIYTIFDYTESTSNIIFWPLSMVILLVFYYLAYRLVLIKVRWIPNYAVYNPKEESTSELLADDILNSSTADGLGDDTQYNIYP